MSLPLCPHAISLPGVPWWRAAMLLALLTLGRASAAVGDAPSAGCAPHAPGTATAPPELAYVLLPAQLDGRAYYRLDATVTCKTNTAEHTVIKSWANKVSFHGERVLVWGPICNDTPTAIALREAAAEIMVTRDLHILRYKGECLTYAEKPPTLCAQGLWCPVPAEE